MSWWHIVDVLAEHQFWDLASLAQRQAVPLLGDLTGWRRYGRVRKRTCFCGSPREISNEAAVRLCSNSILHASIANIPRTRGGSSTFMGRSVLFLTKRGGRGARTDNWHALVSSGQWIVSCVSRELRAVLWHISRELQAGRDRPRALRVQILPCIGRRFFIDPRRSIDMDYDSEGVSYDCSSASHQNGCESRRRAARGYNFSSYDFFVLSCFSSIFDCLCW